MKYPILSIGFLLNGLIGVSYVSHAQPLADTLRAERGSASEVFLDSLGVLADTLLPVNAGGEANKGLGAQRQDSLDAPPPFRPPIVYQARDSMRLSIGLQSPGWQVVLYGAARVKQADVLLTANQIELYHDQTLYATYGTDTLGMKQEVPELTDAGETYVCEAIKYNFRTKKAYVEGLVTQQDEAYVHGRAVNMMPDQSLKVVGARYTTCNLANPHFHIRSQRVKILPKKHIVSGLFNVYVDEVPLPVFFPFGFWPRPQDRLSGVIFPSYGEERRRGFFLREGGYYFALSPKMALRVTGDVYSKGSYAQRLQFSYLKRYRFSGDVNVRHSYTRGDDLADQRAGNGRDYWVVWNHTPQLKRNAQFSASVEGGASTYNSNNFDNPMQNTRTEFTSNITYRQRFGRSPMSMSWALRHRQNIQTRALNFTLPAFSFNVNALYPFGKNNASEWLRRLNATYRLDARNDLSNEITRQNQRIIQSPISLSELLSEAKNGAQHQIPISTSFSLLKYFVVSPQISYKERWYLRSLSHRYDASIGGLRTDTISGFSRAGEYSASVSMATRLYGTFFFGQPQTRRRIQALRHTLNPSISFQYQPDFGHSRYGVHSRIVGDNGTIYERSRYDGFIYGTTPKGERAAMQFAISNQLELKVLNKKDTLGGTKKIALLDNLSLSGSYNFAADSFQLSAFQLSARTRLFNQVDVSASATLDPYAWVQLSNPNEDLRQRRTASYAWNQGQGIGQFSNVTLSINFQWRADPKTKRQDTKTTKVQYKAFVPPWNINTRYNLSYRKNGFAPADIIQSIALDGGLSITPKTHLRFSSSYDVTEKRFTQTSIDFTRDLHCWEIVGSWIPFGRFTSYQVTFRAKASILRDLKLSRQRSFFDSL